MSMDSDSLQFAQKLAHIKARQLAQRMPALDPEDVAQDLLTEIALRWSGFDAARGNSEALIEKIVRSKVCKIIRGYKRERKRSQHIAQMLRPSFDPADQHDDIRDMSLQLDVRVVVSRLPRRLRDACDHLQRDTQKAAASAVGMSRNGLAGALTRARPLFRKGDLDSYL